MSSRESLQSEPSEMLWHSTRLRMAHLVEPYGCDAHIDHVLVFRAPHENSWVKKPVEIGRAMEREEIGDSRGRWRLVEVVTQDLLRSKNLDGVEVYSEPVHLDEADIIPFGTTFQPERSMPARRELPMGGQSTAAKDSHWFSLKLRWACMIEGLGCKLFNDCIFLVRATDFDTALERAVVIGRSEEHEYLNGEGERILWPFVEVLALTRLGPGELRDVVDVHTEEMPLRDSDRVPFGTVFCPEQSKPEMTGV
ncbi:MAG: DUF4288 domain-containing protein [Reyranellaceae bacterium]